MPKRDVFDSISPIDYRYWDEKVAEYLSENAFTKYKLRVELALIKALHNRGLCSKKVVKEVRSILSQVTTGEIYIEEKIIHHDIRALVNKMRDKVSEETKRFIHMTATSYDISDTANAARYRDVIKKVVIPVLVNLEKTFIELALREAETVQIGRTHGQHAVPITFGFTIAEYISRLGNCILNLQERSGKVVGKFSGAVGACNASSLFFDDPEEFEKEVLEELGLKPAEYSTQIVPPEPIIRLLSELILTGGVLANLARDMRNLQRTEIGEVGEEFKKDQVGSSTMPQKRNPFNFENVESHWGILVGRLVTVYLDQISEHQRDLTNSASARTYGEIIGYLVSMSNRLNRTVQKLSIDKENLKKNLEIQKGLIVAEPLYIILAALGHPDAHEIVRKLTLKAQSEERPLEEIAIEDSDLKPYLKKMTSHQREIISNPSSYTGVAAYKAKKIAETWLSELNIIAFKLTGS